MRAALSRGIYFVVFSDLDSSWLRIWVRGQAPQPRSGAPKAQSLRCAHIRNIIVEIANIFLLVPPAFVSAMISFRSKRALCMRAALAAPTYIRPVQPVPRSLMRVARRGSKGDGTILYRGVFQPCRNPVTHPPWISYASVITP